MIGSAAYAAIPAADGTITACYSNATTGPSAGAVRIIDAEAGVSCRSNETTLAFHQEGLEGPPGSDCLVEVLDDETDVNKAGDPGAMAVR